MGNKNINEVGVEVKEGRKGKKIKNVGVSLLFVEKAKKKWIGHLKSYVINANTWNELNEEVLTIVKKEIFNKKSNPVIFVGIDDVFYVSDTLKQFAILGKTYYEEYTKKEDAKSLIIKRKVTLDLGWQLCELVYLYKDKNKGDSFVLTCITLIKADDFKALENKIIHKANSSSFKSKILTKRLDKLNSNFLEYVGIKNITFLGKKLSKSSCFESYSREANSIEDFLKELPPIKELKQKEW